MGLNLVSVEIKNIDIGSPITLLEDTSLVIRFNLNCIDFIRPEHYIGFRFRGGKNAFQQLRAHNSQQHISFLSSFPSPIITLLEDTSLVIRFNLNCIDFIRPEHYIGFRFRGGKNEVYNLLVPLKSRISAASSLLICCEVSVHVSEPYNSVGCPAPWRRGLSILPRTRVTECALVRVLMGKKFSHEISVSVWDQCPPSIVMHLGSYDRPTDTRTEMDNESDDGQFSENEILSVLCSAFKTGETSLNINKGALPDNSNAKENRPSENGLLQIRHCPSSVTDVDDPEEFVSATYSTFLHSSEKVSAFD
ncbi:hypothetical protein ANN_00939 [Periplaneta americana]|uniref:Uncharacterized protein n=1 Tax=Periplaneta americana TaxID=6978 RepID=A0ABQ8TUM4_PERAM|nr:hypothetical protein ANN_00939 [Periplaneta americana]